MGLDSARPLRESGVRIIGLGHHHHHHHRPHGPVETLIRVHAHSLKLARRHHFVNKVCHVCPGVVCPVLDAGQFRILLNEARREIDRLRRQCDGIPCCSVPPLNDQDCYRPNDSLSAELAKAPLHRKSYAMPIGDVGRSRLNESAGRVQCAHEIHSYLAVSNLGTLLDVLG